jgi:micrococcal nuclease
VTAPCAPVAAEPEDATMAPSTEHRGRTPSATEQRNRRRRRQAVVIATIGLLGIVLFVASMVSFVWLIGEFARADSQTPYAARPTVVRVIDGDTIEVRVGHSLEHIRLLGIDTPETKDPRKPQQCFGHEASEHTASLLPKGTIVRLERDLELHDAYDRTLAYVWRESDGLFVNLDLAMGGYADVLSIAPNTAHADELRAAVDAAKAEPRGLWRTCGGPGRPVS